MALLDLIASASWRELAFGCTSITTSTGSGQYLQPVPYHLYKVWPDLCFVTSPSPFLAPGSPTVGIARECSGPMAWSSDQLSTSQRCVPLCLPRQHQRESCQGLQGSKHQSCQGLLEHRKHWLVEVVIQEPNLVATTPNDVWSFIRSLQWNLRISRIFLERHRKAIGDVQAIVRNLTL